jgi:hypothetical protein
LNNIIVLDTGVLGMLVHPAETGEPWEGTSRLFHN